MQKTDSQFKLIRYQCRLNYNWRNTIEVDSLPYLPRETCMYTIPKNHQAFVWPSFWSNVSTTSRLVFDKQISRAFSAA